MLEQVVINPPKPCLVERSRTLRVIVLVVLVVFATSSSLAQTTVTTVTKRVKNPDPWTVIEYPAGKEVMVKLTPETQLPEAEGWATVNRSDEGTKVNISIAIGRKKTEILEKRGVKYRGWQTSNNEFKTCIEETIAIDDGVVTKTNETCKGTTVVQVDSAMDQQLIAYAVDDRGAVTALGPLIIKDGSGTMSATTPLTRFMLVLSPQTLTSIDNNMRFTFQSAVPAGFAVIPIPGPEGERVAAVGNPSNAYRAPILTLPALRPGDNTKLKVEFIGSLSGTTADAVITRRQDAVSEVKLSFNNLNEAPAGWVFVLWAVSFDYKMANLGRIVNTPPRNEAEIKADIPWSKFGLFITLEDAANGSGRAPLGPTIAIIRD